MHRALFVVALLVLAASSRAEDDIVTVLARSQALRLERTTGVDLAGARARTVRASFETLVGALVPSRPFELKVVAGDTVAETLQGRTVVANEALADLSEGERLFILAHELGHVELRHWTQTEQLYQKWVPGAVTPDRTEPVAALLGRDASGLAHRQEFEADAYALRALRLLGLSSGDAASVFVRLGVNRDTATHPATGKRLAALRAAEAATSAGAHQVAVTRNEPIDSVKRPD